MYGIQDIGNRVIRSTKKKAAQGFVEFWALSDVSLLTIMGEAAGFRNKMSREKKYSHELLCI